MKKFKFIGLALVMSFVLMGAAYAAWTDKLSATATVNTGTLSAAITSASITGTPTDPNSPAVASVSPVSSDNTTKDITVTLDKVYPGYTATANYTIKNTGSIPIKIGNPTFTPQMPDGASDSDLTVTNTNNPVGQTLLAGATFNGSVALAVNESAKQGAKYEVTASVPVTQWNQ